MYSVYPSQNEERLLGAHLFGDENDYKYLDFMSIIFFTSESIVPKDAYGKVDKMTLKELISFSYINNLIFP
jgi:hypothetical protein